METQSPPRFRHADFDQRRSTESKKMLCSATSASGNRIFTAPPETFGDQKLSFNEDGTPHRIIDDEKTCYSVGVLLGKGGFARVYYLTTKDTTTDGDAGESILAGKIICKSRLSKPEKKDKIAREIDIQRKMLHKNVVLFIKFFEDRERVFILMEYCGTKTLSSILKKRSRLTEPEIRYYLKQLLAGCDHIHSLGVVHRDLKLSNLFINDQMSLKIGDFGLSAYISHSDDKKESICGTPNYISPEVILKVGHSYPADVWAIGCIVYALISGRPPFETGCLKDTYKLISKSKYNKPTTASLHARSLIASCLRIEPERRPSIRQLKEDNFLQHGYTPVSLLSAAAVSPPDFGEMNKCEEDGKNGDVVPIDTIQYYIETIQEQETCAQGGRDLTEDSASTIACQVLLDAMGFTLRRIDGHSCRANPKPVSGDDCIWITKWVDYSHKYGFGFQLSNEIYGASFKDGFSIAVNREGSVGLYDPAGGVTIDSRHSDDLGADYQKRYQVMKYFMKYMDDTLIRGGDADDEPTEQSSLSGVYILRWMRTRDSIIMCLSTATVQVNWFHDHTKLVVSKVKRGGYQVMYVNKHRQSSVYNLHDINKSGLTSEVKLRLQYATIQLNLLLTPVESTLS